MKSIQDVFEANKKKAEESKATNKKGKKVFNPETGNLMVETPQVEDTPETVNAKLILMLKNAFAEEMLAYYQYLILEHFTGMLPVEQDKDYTKLVKSVVTKFKTNAEDELRDHAYWILGKLKDMGADCTSIENPSLLNQFAMHKYICPTDTNNLMNVIEQVAQTERDAIETYNALVAFTEEGDKDINKKMKSILNDEEKHLKEMEDFMEKIKEYRNKLNNTEEKKK
jgi:ferritin-like protein